MKTPESIAVEIERILSPAIDAKAPYAKQMIRMLVEQQVAYGLACRREALEVVGKVTKPMVFNAMDVALGKFDIELTEEQAGLILTFVLSERIRALPDKPGGEAPMPTNREKREGG